ncbi:hypothetical protein [Azospirillum rugosum]|uniref:CopL family metal-binding regulatory protein n=1 Tax=Azospirillum rugosum TaxID=416170 RepID=A0ABS4SJG5_9PROT|nr:hypothetical protein [Azospirillum rugosum]MBP2292701.1 hypothetical protein [Azospirillum rugosum]MDQ0526275.1 hypothetical protein [Azospirillum rugosum]
MSLLMLATLLVYAVPSHASLAQHQPPAPHEHALAAAHDDAAIDMAADVAGPDVADHEHDPCKGRGLPDDGACCSVAQCATMHGGLPAVSFEPFVPHADKASHRAAFATPKGIDVDPALRPPL